MLRVELNNRPANWWTLLLLRFTGRCVDRCDFLPAFWPLIGGRDLFDYLLKEILSSRNLRSTMILDDSNKK